MEPVHGLFNTSLSTKQRLLEKRDNLNCDTGFPLLMTITVNGGRTVHHSAHSSRLINHGGFHHRLVHHRLVHHRLIHHQTDLSPGRLIAGSHISDKMVANKSKTKANTCLLYTSPSPRDGLLSRMPSSA